MSTLVPLMLLLLGVAVETARACPHTCRCSLDERGRRGVRCEAGAMSSLPVMDMSAETEILVISAPPSRTNRLTLGPLFKGLKRLEEVHITYSMIPALGAHSFWGLERLHILNLTHNHISAIRENNFNGAKKLHHLDLSHNRIQSVPSAVFRHVHHLRSITLAHNLVPELMPRVFFGLSKLERLDLSYNPLGELQPDRFSDVPELRQLLCAGCHLSSISSTLLQLVPQLHELDLRNNRLTQVPIGITSATLPHLSTLKLDGNHISFVEQGATADSTVTTLHLAHNRISRLEPKAFVNSTLKHLDLSYNRLSHLESGALMGQLLHLHDLQLSGNSLNVEQLMMVLPTARQLRRLGLGDMGLTRIPPELLPHSNHLHHLNLSANYLTVFNTEVLRKVPKLHSLDLSLNTFRGLDDAFFTGVNGARDLRILRLEGNPWQCDQCHAGPLLQWLQDAPDQESGCNEPRVWTCLKCAGPEGVTALQLALLPPGDLPPCPFTTPAAVPVMPTWLEPSLSVVTEEPQLPRGQLTRQENIDRGWPINSVDQKDLYLIIVAGCILILLVLVLIVVGIVLYHRHTAHYYTYENDPEKKVRLMKGKENKNNNGCKKGTKDQTDATIATIDEMTDIAGSQDVMEDEDQPEHNHVPNHNPVLPQDNSNPNQVTQPPDINIHVLAADHNQDNVDHPLSNPPDITQSPADD